MQGLEGVKAAVALTTDPGRQASLAEIKQANHFEPLPGMIHQSGGLTPIWLRIELTVPAAMLGRTAWLEVRPSHAWELQVFTDDGLKQSGGFGIPTAQRSYTSSIPRFAIRLNQPLTHIYLSVVTAAAQLTHLSLLSDEMVQERRLRDAWTQGVFWGVLTLMLLVTLMNWLWTRDPLFRSYSFFLIGSALFMMFMDGHITAYMLGDFPGLCRMLIAFGGAMLITSNIYFFLQLLNIGHSQQSKRWLRSFTIAMLCSSLLTIEPELLYGLIHTLLVLYFLSGLVLLLLSAAQVVQQRSRRALWMFVAFFVLFIFEQGPLLAMAGILPVRSWTVDLNKVAMLIQMLLTQTLLAIAMRENQKAKIFIEQQALLAAAEANAERLQRADLTGFLAMFGHEVRTPLAVIDSTTQSLELLPGAELPAVAERHQRIRAAVTRLDRLANLALGRERIEAAEWTPDIRVFQVSEVLTETLAKFGLDLPDTDDGEPAYLPLSISNRSDGRLALYLPRHLPAVFADPHLMQIALENLLDNACKYADPGSTVKLSIEEPVITPADRSARWQLTIHVDSQGPVLSSNDLEKVFDKYWRRDERSETGGAGLGLHLVRRITQLHGGIAQACNFDHGWTRFSIIIPSRPQAL